MDIPPAYCARCRAKTPNESPTPYTAKNGAQMIKSVCANCGTRKSQIIGGPKKKG